MTRSTATLPARIRTLDPDEYPATIPALADLLVDAVRGGAAVNFLASITDEEARAWWVERSGQVVDGTMTVFVAEERASDGTRGGPIVGSAILVRSRFQNSPHRAEVGKVLVHRSVRRQGLGRALMEAVEACARADGRWLLLLDTQTGSAAETLYRALGWHELGTMPNHSYGSNGVLSPTTFFWKDLRNALGDR